MAAAGYDPEADLENPPSSVFCAHGAGFVEYHGIRWRRSMHLEAGLRCRLKKAVQTKKKRPG